MGNLHTIEHQQKVYQRWAPIYDGIYRSILRDGHRKIAEFAARAGQDILEVGVGTGLALRHYPRHCRITGIDVSEHMLAKAREKVTRDNLHHVKMLCVMDACKMTFADNSFDAVCLPFVITLIAEPEQALDECARVLRTGGEIILTSKLSDDTGVQAVIEEAIAPLVHRVGWSSSFRIRQIREWAEQRGDFDVIDIRPIFPGGLFKLMRLKQRGFAS